MADQFLLCPLPSLHVCQWLPVVLPLALSPCLHLQVRQQGTFPAKILSKFTQVTRNTSEKVFSRFTKITEVICLAKKENYSRKVRNSQTKSATIASTV